MRRTLVIPAIVIAVTLASAASVARARNVDLSTVPRCSGMLLTIYKSEHLALTQETLTLVRETRTVTFRKGVNPLEFSWANTLIDPSSVELRFLTSPEKLDVLDTRFPHDKPKVLYWNVQSDLDGEATVEISYFTSGITWTADYVCVADNQETKLGLEGFVRVYNHSGEEFENAQVRLVLGTINLVEKIALLARLPEAEVLKMNREALLALEERALKQTVNEPPKAPATAAPDVPAATDKRNPRQGLGQYFLYSVEGAETIPNGWSKRMRSLEQQSIPFKVHYCYRPQEFGDQLVRTYVFNNDKASRLGGAPLPDGTIRLFRDNGHNGGLSYLTTQPIRYVPVGGQIEVNLGTDPEVVFELTRQRVTRDNIWMRLNGADIYRQARTGAAGIDVNATVAGWDEHEFYQQQIRNYSGNPIDVEIRRSWTGDVTFVSQLKPELYDRQTVRLQTSVAPGKEAKLSFEVITHQGHNATQQNTVTLRDGEVVPWPEH